MAEDIKNLIEKIQQEGIAAGEEKAKDIEAQARRQTEALVEKAKKEAEGIIAEAKERVARMEKSTRVLLEQAGRNLLLALREEINAMLNRLLAAQLRQALGPGELISIITTLIKNSSGKERDKIIVSLNQQDLAKLKKHFLDRLKELARQGVSLRSSKDIHAGFIISYDSARSHYDFTDQALAQYLGLYLKPKLAEMLDKVASGGKKAQKKG